MFCQTVRKQYAWDQAYATFLRNKDMEVDDLISSGAYDSFMPKMDRAKVVGYNGTSEHRDNASRLGDFFL